MGLITARTNPHETGWDETNFEDDGSGSSQAVDPASDAVAIFDTAFEETNASASTTGTICKVTFGGGLEDNSRVRVLYDWIDSNHYRYAELHVGGLPLFAELKNDVVRLYKVVGGVTTQVSGTTPVRFLQQEAGDLRHYLFQARGTSFYPALTVLAVGDQHLVKVSLRDGIDDHARDLHDWIVLQETDTRHAGVWSGGGKVGVMLVGGAHTTVVRSVQAMLMDAFLCDPVNGDDTASGSFLAPKRSLGGIRATETPGLMDVVRENDIGFVKDGVIQQSIDTNPAAPGSFAVVNFPTAQVSFEDCPVITNYGNHTPIWRSNNSTGCLHFKGSVYYYYIRGLDLDGNLIAKDTVKLWAQAPSNSGETPHYWRFDLGRTRRSGGGSARNNILIGHGTFSGESTPNNYEQFHHFIDWESAFGTEDVNAQGSHGFYCEAGRNVVEYCHFHSNEGNGAKFSYGTSTGRNGVKMTNHNIFRFCRAHGNELWGLLVYAGINNRIDFNVVWENCTRTSPIAGIGAWNGAEQTYIRNNVAYRNGFAGSNNSNLAVHARFNSHTPGPTWIDANTLYGGRGYNVTVLRDSTEQMGPVHLTNTVMRGASTADELISAGLSYATNAHNWRQSDGDPAFTNVEADEYTIRSDSPLRDAGADQAWSLPVDHRRATIPQNLARSIGAYDVLNPLPAQLNWEAPGRQGLVGQPVLLAPQVVDVGGRARVATVLIQDGQLSLIAADGVTVEVEEAS